MDAAALEDIAARLFDAFVSNDLDTVGAMMAPWKPISGLAQASSKNMLMAGSPGGKIA